MYPSGLIDANLNRNVSHLHLLCDSSDDDGEWGLPGLTGMTLMVRATYTSRQYLDVADRLSIAPWTRFDLGARYRRKVLGHETELRAMVLNVANHAYWASTLGGYLTRGAPRTVMLSLSTDF
jgi:iron complex outermembrane receptor protein